MLIWTNDIFESQHAHVRSYSYRSLVLKHYLTAYLTWYSKVSNEFPEKYCVCPLSVLT